MPDHVHLPVSLGRESSVSDVVRQIRGSSSRWVHETIPGLRGFAWQAGYAAYTVSYPHLETLKQYIATQANHHRNVTFALARIGGDTSRALLLRLRRHASDVVRDAAAAEACRAWTGFGQEDQHLPPRCAAGIIALKASHANRLADQTNSDAPHTR
jgi:hypothetical protein